MKKTVIAILLAVTCMLVGCGSSEKVISGEVNNVGTDNTETADTQGDDAGLESEGQNDAAAKAEGYVFEAQGVEIVIDADASAYIDALGEPLSYYEAPSCAFGDLDKIYTYSGFELDTYSLEGVDYVSAVILKDDSVTTPEGLCIGDTASKIKELYGEPTSAEGNTQVYVKDHMKLMIMISDDSIVNIQYLSRVLE